MLFVSTFLGFIEAHDAVDHFMWLALVFFCYRIANLVDTTPAFPHLAAPGTVQPTHESRNAAADTE